jgi:hypothetical protein
MSKPSIVKTTPRSTKKTTWLTGFGTLVMASVFLTMASESACFVLLKMTGHLSSQLNALFIHAKWELNSLLFASWLLVLLALAVLGVFPTLFADDGGACTEG